MLLIIPPGVLYLLTGKYIITGLTGSDLKG